jgi:hypothetical protein
MDKTVLFNKKSDQSLEVDICAISDWNGFDKLIQFLKNEYSVEIVNKIDGPDARRWILKVRGLEFELRHDDGYGNYFYASSADSEDIIKEIGEDLERRLSGIGGG